MSATLTRPRPNQAATVDLAGSGPAAPPDLAAEPAQPTSGNEPATSAGASASRPTVTRTTTSASPANTQVVAATGGGSTNRRPAIGRATPTGRTTPTDRPAQPARTPLTRTAKAPRPPRSPSPVPSLAGPEALKRTPQLRRRPIPDHSPLPARTLFPDDEGDTGCVGQEVLQLRFPPPRRRPEEVLDEDDFASPATSSSELPDPHKWASRFVIVAMEVSLGLRPVTQLTRMTALEVHATLSRRAALVARVERRNGVSGRRPFLRALRVCEVRDGVCEVAAVVAEGDRIRAIALRMEGTGGRWQVTVLEIG